MVTGIGLPGSGIRLEASGLGTSNNVSLTNSVADGNGTNFNYGSAPQNITNLTRNGNINDNLAIVMGTGSRILDTLAGSKATGTILGNGSATVSVSWPILLPTNYAVSCSLDQGTPSPNLRIDQIQITVSQGMSSGVSALIVNGDAINQHSGNVHCIAVMRPPF